MSTVQFLIMLMKIHSKDFFWNYATTELKVDGITISPGFAYERDPINNIL